MDIVTKNQAIEVVENYMAQSQEQDKLDKCKDILAKFHSITEEDFNKFVHQVLGENADLNAFDNWLTAKLQEH